jgi:hypothetical protein
MASILPGPHPASDTKIGALHATVAGPCSSPASVRGAQRAYYESEYGPNFGGRLGPQIFSGGRSVRQLRSPPVERDDPQREFERASIERLGELGDSYEIVA